MPVRRLTILALFLAAAVVLYQFAFSLPFFPAFLKYDGSDVPIIVGALAFGPVAGLVLELAKNLVHAFSAGLGNPIGLVANFAAGGLLVLGTSLVSRTAVGQRWRWLCLVVGVPVMAFGLIPLNIYFFLPPHGITGPAAATMATGLLTPFNLVKGLIDAGVGLVLFQRLRSVLKVQGTTRVNPSQH